VVHTPALGARQQVTDSADDRIWSVHVRRGDVQDRPTGGDQRIEPAPVPCELTGLPVPGAVVLDGHPLLGKGQIDTSEEPPVGVTDDVLRHRRESRGRQQDAQDRLRRGLRPSVRQRDRATCPSDPATGRQGCRASGEVVGMDQAVTEQDVEDHDGVRDLIAARQVQCRADGCRAEMPAHGADVGGRQ
jgi:hypothetical protein